MPGHIMLHLALDGSMTRNDPGTERMKDVVSFRTQAHRHRSYTRDVATTATPVPSGRALSG